MELRSIELHPLADFHIGDAMCDFGLIREKLAHILETPNAYCILGGDLMDTAVCSSIGDTYGANLQPMEQLSTCVKLFGPLAEAGKILAILHGNHENRVYRSDGIDMTSLMAQQLGIGDRYSDTSALLFLRFGIDRSHGGENGRPRRQSYIIYATHGSGGGRKEGGKVNRLSDLSNIVDADIYVHSHTHMPVVFKTGYFRSNPNNSTVQRVDKLFVNTAGCLEYGGYGDVNGYKPTSTCNPVIYLDGRRKKATAAV